MDLNIKINEAYGKLSDIYISYAHFYEENNDIEKANEIFYKGCNLNYKKTEENINIWCLWCEMNVRQKKYKDVVDFITYFPFDITLFVKNFLDKSD